jgi:hypothetical protein
MADRELLFGMIEEGDGLGFSPIQVTSNGFWGKDLAEARENLRECARLSRRAKFVMELSCDPFHNAQPLLQIEYLANIMFLVITEFPAMGLCLNCISTRAKDTQLALILNYCRLYLERCGIQP